MWDDKQYDVNRLVESVNDPDNLFTTDEPYVSGTMALYHHETEEIHYLEEDDPEEVLQARHACGVLATRSCQIKSHNQ